MRRERPFLMAVCTTLTRRNGMFQHEAMRDLWPSEAQGYADSARGEETSLSSEAGQKLLLEASGQAPTVGQRLTLALVSLGMLMGMSTLLTILATARNAPGWVVFPFLFVLTLFTVKPGLVSDADPQW